MLTPQLDIAPDSTNPRANAISGRRRCEAAWADPGPAVVVGDGGGKDDRLGAVLHGSRHGVLEIGVGAAQREANRAKWRERLVIPPATDDASKLAAAYQNDALGRFRVRVQDGATAFDFGLWHSAVVSRCNDEGTTSFISIDPTVDGFDIVVGA